MKNPVSRVGIAQPGFGVSFGAAVVSVAGMLLLAMSFVLSSESSVQALTNCDVDSAEIPLNSAEAEFLVLINNYRAENGKGPLTNVTSLNRAGVWHSADMIAKGYFAHNEPGGRTWSQRMTDCGYPTGGFRGENIAAGFSSATSVFNAWKNSPGHNANMLNGNFSKIGIGKVGSYWNTDFGSVADSGGGSTGPTATPSPTSVPSTPTNTSVPATATATRTPSNTPTATATSGGGSQPTATPRIPTATPTATKTATPVNTVATSTPTNTTVPATATATKAPPTATPGVSQGANLVAWTGGSVSPQSVTTSQPTVKTIYGWNPVKGVWELYSSSAPGYVNTLKSLKDGYAYWFIVK